MNTITFFLSTIRRFFQQGNYITSRSSYVMVPSFVPPVNVYPSKRPGPSIYREL
ncbi:MAG: hypothetical protein V4717_16280 [Bacteroidota bacterium]